MNTKPSRIRGGFFVSDSGYSVCYNVAESDSQVDSQNDNVPPADDVNIGSALKASSKRKGYADVSFEKPIEFGLHSQRIPRCMAINLPSGTRSRRIAN